MGNWTNEDGLQVQYGELTVARVGGVSAPVQRLVIDFDYSDLPSFTADLNNDGTKNGFFGGDANIPAGAFITNAYIVVTTAFTGGTSYDIGTYKADGTVIDANGIVHVSAKDMATGKEQSIQITASSGLSQEEIDNLVKDAELHAEEDKKLREKVEVKNNADSLIYSTEKSMAELGDKVDAETKAKVDGITEQLKKAMESDDTEEIKRLTEELTQASHKLAEAIYQQASQAGAEAGGPDAAGADPSQNQAAGDDEDVVDADFEEVKDDKK